VPTRLIEFYCPLDTRLVLFAEYKLPPPNQHCALELLSCDRLHRLHLFLTHDLHYKHGLLPPIQYPQ
jgi:hypothetical protein